MPDGILGSRSYDKVPLPADLATVVDLMPYTGLALTMTGAEIKAIQETERRGAQAGGRRRRKRRRRWAMCGIAAC